MSSSFGKLRMKTRFQILALSLSKGEEAGE
jgi:hypothetical protein